VLEDTDEDLRDHYFYEYFPEERAKFHPKNFAIRTRTAKLIHYPENPAWNELYDLKKDPYETENVIDDPAYAATRTQLEKLLRSEAERLKLPAGELKAEGS
jgi:arylsulfatase A-like enzyme